MKVTVIIATMMVAQVSASFLEAFQGAVLSVQNSFGKLFSDVVTDVKDTVDCTILAVEHILSLSEDATARYYKQCGSAKNDTQSDSQLKNNFPVVEISIANNEEYLKKELPEEIDARINATLLKFLDGYNPHDQLEDVQKELAKETERLADVSDLVRQELYKLSKEIHLDVTNVERKGYKPSVDSILGELKVLEAIEQNIRNASEANEIHRLVDDVLNKLHVIESSGANQNYKVDGILSDLERSSNRSYKDMRQQLEDWKAEEARHLNVIKAKIDEHEKLPKHLEYEKIDNVFATIERPKIYIVPIEQEIASKTVTLNSKNTVESMSPNIVTNTDSIFLTSITKQISSTPKIIIQPSIDATSPVQINDASGVITPVSISTSSYVNEINVDVMETTIPQRFKEEPMFDTMPDTNLDYTTPISIAEITFHSTNLATREPTIELLERSLKHTISRPVFIPEATSFVPNTTQLSTSPSLETTRESNTSALKKTQERNTSVQKAISRGSSDTNLGINLNHFNRNPTTTQLGNATSSSGTNTIEEQITEKPTSAPETITEPNTSSAMMQPKATTYVSVMSPQPTITAMTSKSATSLLMTATNPTKSSTMIPESTTSIPMSPELTIFVTTAEPVTSIAKTAINAATPLESTESTKVTALKPTTRLAMTSEFTTDLSLTAPESTTSFTVTPEFSTYPSMTPTERDTNSTTPPEPTRDLPVTVNEPIVSSAVNPEPTMDPLVITPESSTNSGMISELSTDLQVTVSGEIINSVMMPKFATNSRVVATAAITSPTMTQDSNTSFAVTASRLISFATKPEPTTNLPMTSTEPTTTFTTTPELTTNLQVTATGVTINSVTMPKPMMDLPATTPEPATSAATNTESTIDILVTVAELSTNPATTPELTTDLQEMATGSTINSIISREPATSLLVTATDPTKSSTAIPEPTTSIPMTAPDLNILVTTPEPTTSTAKTAIESTRNAAMPLESTKSLKVTGLRPTNRFAMTSEFTTDLLLTAPETTTCLTATLEPSTFSSMTRTEPGTDPTTPPEPTTDLSVTATEPATSSAVNQEPTMDPLITISESTTNPETIPELSTNLQVTATGEIIYSVMMPKSATNIQVMATEATTSPTMTQDPNTSLKASESNLGMISEYTTRPTKTSEPILNMLMINSDAITGPTTTPEPTRSLPMTISERKSSVTIPDPIINYPVTTLEPTISSEKPPGITTEAATYHLVKTTGIRTSAHVRITESTSSSPKIMLEQQLTATVREPTNHLAPNRELTPSSTETMSKSTTGSLGTPLKLVTNLSNLQHPFNLRTHRPGVPTPSLNAFLNYIDRKEGFTRPIIQSKRITATPVATPVGAEVKILPLSSSSYSKLLSAVTNDLIKAKLNAFFSHLPPQNISSPYARSDFPVPANRTVPGVLGLTRHKIGHDMPLPYIMKPSRALNKNAHPRPLSFRHLAPHRPYNESPYVGNNNAPPLGKGMPQKSHILLQRKNDENTPIHSSVTLTSSSLGLTTNKPVPTPKTNNYDDADYKSFFHFPSKDSEAHSRALKEARKLIEDSKRADRIINNVFNKKNKGISAFHFPKSLKIGK